MSAPGDIDLARVLVAPFVRYLVLGLVIPSRAAMGCLSTLAEATLCLSLIVPRGLFATEG
jgi:hypothetical protein